MDVAPLKVCIVYSYPSSKGLGAWLRCCISLCYFCMKNGWLFDVDFSDHPIGNYLEETKHVIDKIYKTRSEFDLKLIAQRFTGIKDVIFVDHELEVTNPSPTDNAVNVKVYQEIVSKILRYNSNFLSKKDSALVNKQYKQALHVRLGDIVLIDERDICIYTKESLYQAIDKYIQGNNPRDTVIVCDSYWIKQTLCEKYGFVMIDTRPSHSSLLTDEDSIIDTLIDFYVMCNSRSIHVIHGVKYTSSFSLVPHVLYNIPHSKEELVIKPSPGICWNCRKLKLRSVRNLHHYVVCGIAEQNTIG